MKCLTVGPYYLTYQVVSFQPYNTSLKTQHLGTGGHHLRSKQELQFKGSSLLDKLVYLVHIRVKLIDLHECYS